MNFCRFSDWMGKNLLFLFFFRNKSLLESFRAREKDFPFFNESTKDGRTVGCVDVSFVLIGFFREKTFPCLSLIFQRLSKDFPGLFSFLKQCAFLYSNTLKAFDNIARHLSLVRFSRGQMKNKVMHQNDKKQNVKRRN
jgi:hypothetical protein